MLSNGRRPLRHLIPLATAIISLVFVWFLLPDRIVSREIRIALGEPGASLSASSGTAPLAPIRLVSLVVPPRTADAGQLVLKTGDTESTIRVSEGQTITIDGTEYDVTAIRPWVGLLHRPPGVPMLNVAVKPPGGEWMDNLFVQRGGALIVTPEIALIVADDDAGFLKTAARWAVVEGVRVHWFSSFVPGTGLELADGGIVTLLARRPSGRILVEIAEGGSKSTKWVEANRDEPGSRFRYEDPTVVPIRIEIDVNDDGPSSVSIVEGDLERWTRSAEIGSILVDEESGLSVRIDQDERDAVALFADESPWLEVVLSNSGRVLRIREGEAIRLGENLTTFDAFANTQTVQAEIDFGGTTLPFGVDSVHEVDVWRFGQMRTSSPSEIVLEAANTSRRWRLRMGLTALLVAAVSAYMYTARRKA